MTARRLTDRMLTWGACGLCLAAVLLAVWAWLDPLGPDWRVAKAWGCGALAACVIRVREYVRRAPIPGRSGDLLAYEKWPAFYHFSFIFFMALMGFVAWLGFR
jgi:hypothetical protein